MWGVFGFVLIISVQSVFGGHYPPLCDDNINPRNVRTCTTHVLGQDHIDSNSCHVEYYPIERDECTRMNFSTIPTNVNIGGVTLKPYIWHFDELNGSRFNNNVTVMNITFTNIKWKAMKFRFNVTYEGRYHCRNVLIANNVTVNDQSVLYYDCFWAWGGQSQKLEFEATDNKVVQIGRLLFNVPSASTLSSTIREEEWEPFIYIEIQAGITRLHIMPPAAHLNITSYEIKLKRKSEGVDTTVKSVVKELKNYVDEVTYDYSMFDNGLFYFEVTPLHAKCNGEGHCRTVKSHSFHVDVQSLNICIASISALIVAVLFGYYVALRLIRRYWCKDPLAYGNVIPAPTKVLVVYSSANRLHSECVASFVEYLRSAYGFEVMYDGDISSTSHGDPFIWASEAHKLASHILYIVGPAEEANHYNNIYDKSIISPHKNVDKLLLSLIKGTRVTSAKDLSNVFFEHSNGTIPIETKHDKVFFLLRDWQKLIAHLSKNLLPKRQIMRSEKGRSFLEDLTRAKKLLNLGADDVIKCDRAKIHEKKVLL